MKCPLTTVALLAALLVPAGPAHAKGVIAAKVCGADDCRAVSDDQRRSLLLEGGAPAVHFYIMQSATAVKKVLDQLQM